MNVIFAPDHMIRNGTLLFLINKDLVSEIETGVIFLNRVHDAFDDREDVGRCNVGIFRGGDHEISRNGRNAPVGHLEMAVETQDTAGSRQLSCRVHIVLVTNRHHFGEIYSPRHFRSLATRLSVGIVQVERERADCEVVIHGFCFD